MSETESGIADARAWMARAIPDLQGRDRGSATRFIVAAHKHRAFVLCACSQTTRSIVNISKNCV